MPPYQNTNHTPQLPLKTKFSITVLLTIGFASIAHEMGLSNVIFPKDYVVSLYDADGQKIDTFITEDMPEFVRETSDSIQQTIWRPKTITDKFSGATHSLEHKGVQSMTIQEIAESNRPPEDLRL